MDAERLLERVREQATVIDQLWDRYTQDVGREPELDGPAATARFPQGPLRAPAKPAPSTERGSPNFEQAVRAFDFRCTHTYNETNSQQRVAELMTDRRQIGFAARRAGDVVISGFWGTGVSLGAFNLLLKKLRRSDVPSVRKFDVSDNGLDDIFVPGILEVLKKGVRKLNLSSNGFETESMWKVLVEIPRCAPFLESLDVRFNPCAYDATFQTMVSEFLPDMAHLEHVGLQIRCDATHRSVRPRAQPMLQRASSATRRSRTPDRDVQVGRAVGSSHVGGTNPSFRRRASSCSGVQRLGRWVDLGRSGQDPRMESASKDKAGVAARIPPEIRSGVAQNSIPVRRGSRDKLAANRQNQGLKTQPESGPVDGAVALLRGASQCQKLRYLDLRGSCFATAAVHRLSNLIKGLHLTSLNLADCFLGASAEPILDALTACNSLVCLNLRLNALRGHTGFELCRAFDTSVSLTDVDISSNDLGDDFGQAFAKVLSSNDILHRVNLARNPLTKVTGETLLQVLQKRNDTITNLGNLRDDLLELGLLCRFLLDKCLESNRKGVKLTQRPKDVGVLGPKDFKWEILEDPLEAQGLPPGFEPVLGLHL